MKNFSMCKAGNVFTILSCLMLCTTFFQTRGSSPDKTPFFTVLQQSNISGTVADARGPLPDVTVSVKGTKYTTVTDSNGHFTIPAEIGDTLVFSYMGYATLSLLAGQATLDVLMQADATSLQEVTVNAGYYSVKDRERTGNIARVTASAIEKQPVTNTLAALQGRMAGVDITQDTGTPGGGFSIQIRGINSLRGEGNAPLYIIDGVPYSSEPVGAGITQTIMPAVSTPLNNLNPGDVESIEILKDADATAIYGSRGANGVVLITTKKGKAGKTRFNATVNQGFGSIAHFMKLMNTQQYLAMRAEAFANDGITDYPENAYDINGTWDTTRNTDWQKTLLGGTAKFTNASVGVSGGSERTQFLLSSNYARETTVLPGDFAYEKGNMRTNISHTSENQKFKVVFSAGYTKQKNDQPSTDLSTLAWALPPDAPALRNPDGSLNWENNTFDNPLALLNGKSKTESRDLVANAVLTYQLTDGLEAKANLGYTDLAHSESSSFPSTTYNPAYGVGSDSSSLFYSDAARQSWLIEPQLNWKKNFSSLKTDVLVGTTFQKQDNKLLGMSAYGFTSNSMIYNPAAAMSLSVFQYDESVYKYQSVFGRMNLNYKSKYILNLTGRRDGSSRFGPGNRYGWFGAVGAAWLFGDEEWLKSDKGIFSFGKLRASYGTTGNDQIGNYQFLNTYTPSGNSYQGIIGLQPSRLYNPDFGWETNKKFEVALETGFLKDRIFTTLAYYDNRSSNQLVGIPMPGTVGFPSLQSNLDATVANSGIEFTLRTENFKGKDFSWNTSFNISVAKNKLVSFPNLASSTYSNQYAIGEPLNIVMTYHYTGIDPQTGIYTFEDVNGDGAINATDDKKFAKDLNPKYFGGLQNQLNFRNWQLDFLFQFVKKDNYNTPAIIGVPGTMVNQSPDVISHWQQPGDKGPYQIYTSGDNGAAVNALYQYAASDAVIVDASFIRFKNISVSYQFPANWLPNVNCKASLQAQNLFTITSFKGPDPEFRGIGFLPPLRVITAGLAFNF